MPGKQMTFDSELVRLHHRNRQRVRGKRQSSRRADFYGAMDGASSSSVADAIAAMI